MSDANRASLRNRLAQREPLGVFWMSTGAAAVVELAAQAEPDVIKGAFSAAMIRFNEAVTSPGGQARRTDIAGVNRRRPTP
jgi:hypothetical protein